MALNATHSLMFHSCCLFQSDLRISCTCGIIHRNAASFPIRTATDPPSLRPERSLLWVRREGPLRVRLSPLQPSSPEQVKSSSVIQVFRSNLIFCHYSVPDLSGCLSCLCAYGFYLCFWRGGAVCSYLTDFFPMFLGFHLTTDLVKTFQVSSFDSENHDPLRFHEASSKSHAFDRPGHEQPHPFAEAPPAAT